MTTSDPSDLDLAAMSADELAALVKQAPNEQLEQLVTSDLRKPILDEIFNRMASRLRKDKAAGMDAVIRWRISGRADGDYDRYDLHIADGACAVVEPTAEQPRLTITTDGVHLLKLVTGTASGATLFMTRKLQLAGDLALGAGLTNYFELPRG